MKWALSRENLSLGAANNTGAHKPVIGFLESFLCKLAKGEISR